MSAQELQQLVAGFDDEALGSQAVFRTALKALSMPGRAHDVPLNNAWPEKGQGAAAALLLALLDDDTRLWLSPGLRQSPAGDWLRFHTGCQVVQSPQQAEFLWVSQGDAMPDLGDLCQGTDADPDQSATCVIEVQSLHATAPGWRLSGPGIAQESPLAVVGLADGFLAQWAHNHGLFPRGVDVFLTTPTQVLGLPRTTCILSAGKD